MVEDERAAREGICGATFIGATGIEWICIEKVHGQVYYRKKSSGNHRKGDPIFSGFRADQHYYVRRWRNRDREEE